MKKIQNMRIINGVVRFDFKGDLWANSANRSFSCFLRLILAVVGLFSTAHVSAQNNQRNANVGLTADTAVRLSEVLNRYANGSLLQTRVTNGPQPIFQELLQAPSYSVACQAEPQALDFTPSNWIERNILDFFPEQTYGHMTFYRQRHASNGEIPFVMFYRMIRSTPHRDIRWFGNIQSRGQNFECANNNCSQLRGLEVFSLTENRSSTAPVVSGRRWIVLSLGEPSGLRAKMIVALRLRGVEHFRIYNCSLQESQDQVVPVIGY